MTLPLPTHDDDRALRTRATRRSMAPARAARRPHSPRSPHTALAARSAAVASAALLVLGAATVARAIEWPTYAGGPQRLFFNPAETQVTAANAGLLRVKWAFPTGAIITASPSVAVVDLPGDGPTRTAFVLSWDDNLYALRVSDGTEVWRFATSPQPGATFPDAGSVDLTVVDGRLRAHVGAGETMYAVDAATGAEVWHFDAGTGCVDPPGLCALDGERNEIESSPVVAGGLVVFGMDVNDSEGGKGGLYALDASDGRLAWFFDLESGMTCRPDPGDDVRRYDGYHSESELGLPAGFFATRAGCGHPRTPNGCGNVWSSPAYDAGRGRLFIASSNCDTDSRPATLKPPPPMPPYDEAIFALAIDGTPLWRWRPREVDNDDLAFGAVPNLFSIDVDGTPRDVVGVGNKDGTYYVVDRDGVNGRTGVRWDDPDPSGLPYWSTNVVPGGEIGGIIATAAVDQASRRIFFSTAPGEVVFDPQRPTVHALDADGGAVVWQNTAEPEADASFAPTSAIPGVVFVGSVLGGLLRSYDAATGAKLGAVGLGFALAAAPAVVDGTVLVGAGVGARSNDPGDPSDTAWRTPSNVTALCVPGTPACDGDRDGFDFPDECDDTRADLNPGAREVADDGIDQDCDGRDASAADACGAGGSAGSDARDLAAVRTAIDASCPCASFDGSPGRRHGAYVRCTRPAIRAAIDAGTLRRRCAPRLHVSTCGRPSAAICCQVSHASGNPRCRVRSAGACVGTAAVAAELCPAATHCVDTACLDAGSCAP